MGSRLARVIAAATLSSSLIAGSLVILAPAHAQVVIEGKTVGAEPQSGVERGTVPAEGAQTETAPQKVPAPPPSGCPYRDGTLELIV